jgi:hypothetical protein
VHDLPAPTPPPRWLGGLLDDLVDPPVAQVVGDYQDANGRFHGYVWERGRFRTIDVAGQPGPTTATGINNRSGTDPYGPPLRTARKPTLA